MKKYKTTTNVNADKKQQGKLNEVYRVVANREQQIKLTKVFAREDKDGNLHPLSLSTVRNYLNETRYPYPKAEEVREYAINILGCKWQKIINE